MAVSKLEQIEDYLVAALQGINGTGGYENTVATINQRTVNKIANVSRGPAECFLDFVSSEGNGTGATMGLRARSAVFTATGEVQIPADAIKSKAAMHSLRADMEKAFDADPRCGGLATGLRWSTKAAVGDTVAQCVVTVTVTYTEART